MIDFFISEKQLELVGAVCAAVLVVFPLLKLSVCGVKKQIGRLSLYAKILLGLCIVNSVIVCGTKTNDPPRSAGAAVPVRDGAGRSISLAAFPVSDGAGRSISLSAAPVMVAPEDIVRGYRVVSVATNETPFAEMPSNAVEYAKWSLRGGYETGGIMELWNYGIM